MGRIRAVNLSNDILYKRSNIMIGEIIFWLITIMVVWRFNRDLHKDIFPPREWNIISEVDGQENTIIEEKKW